MLELRKRADKSDGPLRIEGDQPIWPLAGVELVGEAPELHNFADAFIGKALVDGYLEFEGLTATATPGYERNPVVTGDALVLNLSNATLRYEVLQHPGVYEDEVVHEYRCRLLEGGE